MALKEILVVLDNSSHCTARLELAISLARQHGARLDALYVISHPFYEPSHDDAPVRAARVRAIFDAATGGAGIDAHWIGVDWDVVGATEAEIVSLHAHYADLVVVGQDAPGATDRGIQGGLPEKLILGTGRPVLVVPYAGSHANAGERVMLSWKAGRESTRAVNDALPLLQKARAVSVVEIDPDPAGYGAGERLSAHLADHGVTARAEVVVAADVSVGDALLNRISVEGSTLLVMGAYAHTRIGSPVLGDVARHILQHMTVPVMMSH